MAAPTVEELSPSVFDELYSLYPKVLQAFYQEKVKGDDKKRIEALEDDAWRYEEYPTEFSGGSGPKKRSLKKAELERLVKWKIVLAKALIDLTCRTHQTNRPFLLPQIRKNDQTIITQCTTEAYKILELDTGHDNSELRARPSDDTIRKALDKVCELKGVGPATGTLILSVFDPRIPFFEDELFTWLCPEHGAKLKYNTKEYFEMLGRLPEFRKPDSGERVRSYEKIAYVCQHWTYVLAEERSRIRDLIEHEKRNPGEEANLDVGSEQAISRAKDQHELIDEKITQNGKKRKGVNAEEKHEISKRPKRGKK